MRFLSLLLAGISVCGCATTQSRLAGTWEASDGDVMIRIRSDGTFDWSGTLTARLTAFGGLRNARDRVRGQWHPELESRVVWSDYEPGQSRILFMRAGPNAEGVRYFKLAYHEACLVEMDRLEYALMEFSSDEEVPQTQRLAGRCKRGCSRKWAL